MIFINKVLLFLNKVLFGINTLINAKSGKTLSFCLLFVMNGIE